MTFAERDRRLEESIIHLRAALRDSKLESGSIGWMDGVGEGSFLLTYQWGERAALTIKEVMPRLQVVADDLMTETLLVGPPVDGLDKC